MAIGAGLSACRTCGVDVAEGDWACANGHDPLAAALAAAVPAPADPTVAAPSRLEGAIGSTAAGTTRAPEATSCPSGCGQMVLPGWDRCSLCGTQLVGASASLLGPWGSYPVPADGLELGREVGPDPVRSVLAGYTNVSRRHASVAPLEGGWVVTDHGSMNGTTVEGVRVPAHRAVTLVDGCTVGLGATLRFVVRLVEPC